MDILKQFVQCGNFSHNFLHIFKEMPPPLPAPSDLFKGIYVNFTT